MYVFAFGTLKRGFPLHKYLGQSSCLGRYRTAAKFPMLIAGPRFAPMMFNEPGHGFHVRGEVYDVSRSCLKLLDKIESVGVAGNYRTVIKVAALDQGAIIEAFAFIKARDLATPEHTGYLEDYRDSRFIPPGEPRFAEDQF